MSNTYIAVEGAKMHNLKNIDIQIPHHQLVVITGLSGSGKSSLAFDTIYAEGQRRYMETFGSYVRQFMGEIERPDVEQISGLSPVISIEQKTTNRNPRSTVGTVTEIYDFFRLLYARVGDAYSYNTGKKMQRFTEQEINELLLSKYHQKEITLLAPVVRGRKGHYKETFVDIAKKGFLEVRVDGEIQEIKPKMQLDRYKIHDIEIVIDTIAINEKNKNRLSKSIEQAFKLGNGLIMILTDKKEVPIFFSKHLMCVDTGISYEEPSPNTFAFNSPYGACPECKGLGKQYKVSIDLLIPDKTLSIEQGGILALGNNTDGFMYRKVQSIAKKNGISMKKAIKDMTEKQLNILLYGNEKRGEESKIKDYEGIAHMIDRWQQESTSDGALNWVNQFIEEATCPVCGGTRLKKESLYFKIVDKNIAEVSEWDLQSLQQWVLDIEKKLTPKQQAIAKEILKEIKDRLLFLLNVGLYYLTLNRNIGTLSGGESQRIRLATQIGSQLQGITYILDEPSIGLHPRDNDKLIDSLKQLRDIGNNILVVEHDKDIMFAADYVIDIGPKAGVHGGHIVFEGTPQQMLKANTMTAQYLTGEKFIPIPETIREGTGKEILLKGCTGHNLKNIDIRFPLGKLILVTGVSGSGKSTLVNDTLYPIMHNHCYKTNKPVMPYKSIKGLEHIDKIIEIDQSPIGRTPRSNPATYCGFFSDIRELFSSLPESKIRGYKPGRFSFNVKGGRCDMCEGVGLKTIQMNFLPDVFVPCEKCQGKRFNRETLEIRYKGKSITDVLNMTVDEAVDFFNAIPSLYRKIKTLQDVGLGYISLGQNAVTLSGGEAQRIKLATELSKRDTGKTFYILDEPTTGLHFEDIAMLLKVLQKIVDKQNTVLVVEHNLDVIKVADHIIDLGKEGGRDGGHILFAGTVKDLCKNEESYTAEYLRKLPEIKASYGIQ